MSKAGREASRLAVLLTRGTLPAAIPTCKMKHGGRRCCGAAGCREHWRGAAAL